MIFLLWMEEWRVDISSIRWKSGGVLFLLYVEERKDFIASIGESVKL